MEKKIDGKVNKLKAKCMNVERQDRRKEIEVKERILSTKQKRKI